MPLPGQARTASYSRPKPAGTGQSPRAAFWGSLPPAPRKQTLALKEGPKCLPLSSQVSLLRDLGLAPRPMRLGRLASQVPPAAGFPLSCCPGRLRNGSPAPSILLLFFFLLLHTALPGPGPTSAAPGLYKACSSTLAGLQMPPPAWLPPGAPCRYRVTCFDCLTCNC